jgi:hypothetical protein
LKRIEWHAKAADGNSSAAPVKTPRPTSTVENYRKRKSCARQGHKREVKMDALQPLLPLLNAPLKLRDALIVFVFLFVVLFLLHMYTLSSLRRLRSELADMAEQLRRGFDRGPPAQR